MKACAYQIKCLTNLHVGSGETSYNIIDNEIERDSVLGVPVIHSSGLKGALREHFEAVCPKNGVQKPDILRIFGSEFGPNGEKETIPGCLKFLDATLLARPLRISSGKVSFVNATTVELVNEFLSLVRSLGISELWDESLPESIGIDVPEDTFLVSRNDVQGIEGYQAVQLQEFSESELVKKLVGSDFALTGTETFRNIGWPILARNLLAEGISKNLWYEEIVPHQSILYFVILTNNEDLLERVFDKIAGQGFIQFGGNASVGQGFCEVRKAGGSK